MSWIDPFLVKGTKTPMKAIKVVLGWKYHTTIWYLHSGCERTCSRYTYLACVLDRHRPQHIYIVLYFEASRSCCSSITNSWIERRSWRKLKPQRRIVEDPETRDLMRGRKHRSKQVKGTTTHADEDPKMRPRSVSRREWILSLRLPFSPSSIVFHYTAMHHYRKVPSNVRV